MDILYGWLLDNIINLISRSITGLFLIWIGEYSMNNADLAHTLTFAVAVLS